MTRRAHAVFILFLFVVFSLLTVFKIHRWSIPAWHAILDQSAAPEVLSGTPATIRLDDWLLDIPMMFAQVAQHPQFPLVNQNIGVGQQMAVPIQVPVKHWSWIFRPFTWGFVFGNDIGLAWLWWSLTLGLFYFSFLTFYVVSRGKVFISILASAILVNSPFFQLWSFHKAQIAIFWFICFLCITAILKVTGRLKILSLGLILGWALAGMVLSHLYPPILVTFIWLTPFVVGAWIWENKTAAPWHFDARWRFSALVLGFVLAAGVGVLFYVDMRPLIQMLQATTYPGARVSMGGGGRLWPWFVDNFLLSYQYPGGEWGGNACESAAFIFTFPVLLGVFAWSWVTKKKADNKWPAFLGCFFAFLAIYYIFGFPKWLAQLTLFGHATNGRLTMALGVADLLLLVSVLSRPFKVDRSILRNVLGLWFLIQVFFGWQMYHAWSWFKLPWLMSMVFINAGVFYLGLGFQKPKLFLTIILLGSILSTYSFNPWVRGGSDYLFQNPLSSKMLELDIASGHTSRWVVFGSSPVANLPRILGISSLGGYHSHPHFELWKKFDPSGVSFAIYNQCAYTTFLPGKRGEALFDSASPGSVELRVDPASRVFKDLHVNYFLSASLESRDAIEGTHLFVKKFTVSNFSVFERALD